MAFLLYKIICLALFAYESSGKLDLTGEEAAQLVRDEFRYAYQSYLTYAYGYDELRPLWFNGSNWYEFTQLLTPIDSLSTLALMGDQQDLINKTLQLICNFKWETINTYINMFQLIIRDVGGLLSAYWFIKEECLKDLAIDLGERIWNSAFMEPNSFSCRTDEYGNPIAQIPWNSINLATGKVKRDESSQDMAAYTTNLVEFGILSYISGDIRYYRAAKDIMQQILNMSSDLNLPGRKFDVMAKDITNLTQLWPDQGSHIDAGIDSYFEYMIKCYELFGDDDCLEWWNISYPAILEYMSYYSPDDINEERLWFKRIMMQTAEDAWDVGHYDLHAHFFASVVALSGDMETAKKNQEANHYMWSVLNSKVTPFNYDFIQNRIVQPHWDLNPEVMESNYYLYAMTKEEIYFDRALQYLEDIMNVSRCDDIICAGYSALENVNSSDIARKPRCQSFFYAETYKYLYLTFIANTSNGDDIFKFDDYIFNTEAQPLPKEWGSQLLQMNISDNYMLPNNYNNCPSQRDQTMDFNEFWILFNIYGCSFAVFILSVYLLIQLLYSMRRQFHTAYTSAMFHGDGDSSVEQAKCAYFISCHSWISALCSFFTIISIMFFQTDAFFEWNYDINNSEWNSIKWSWITSVTFYMYSKLSMYFAFSFTTNSNISKSFYITRIFIALTIATIIIAQCINNDDFIIQEMVSDSNNNIYGIGVDTLTFIRIMVAIVLIFSLVIFGITLSKFKDIELIMEESSDQRSFIDIYMCTKGLILIIISTISTWTFMLFWSISGDNIFVLPCFDIFIGIFCLLLLSNYNAKIYYRCCGKCHIGFTKCCNIYQEHDEKKLKKIAAFGMRVDLRGDSTQLAPLEKISDNYYDASQQPAVATYQTTKDASFEHPIRKHT